MILYVKIQKYFCQNLSSTVVVPDMVHFVLNLWDHDLIFALIINC